jgi:hypothetical protein
VRIDALLAVGENSGGITTTNGHCEKSPVNDQRKRRVYKKHNIFFEVLRRSIPEDTTRFKPPIFGGFHPAAVSSALSAHACARARTRARTPTLVSNNQQGGALVDCGPMG